MAEKIAFYSGSVYGYRRISDSDYNVNAQAQIFTIASDYSVEYVKLLMIRLNVATTLTVAIYSSDGEYPTGTCYGSKLVDVSGWSTESGAHRTTTFDSPISLSAGTYAIVLTEGSNYSVGWGYSSTGQSGARRRVNTTWGYPFSPDRTYWFEVWGTGGPPSKPTNPTPANAATEVDWSARGLSWDDGGGADTYNVYFGLTGDLTRISLNQVGTSITVDVGDVPYPDVGDAGAAFYWRIDATNSNGTTTGDTWYFDARPTKASVPFPTNTATEVVLGLTTTWTGGATAITYNILVDVGAGLVSQETLLDSATWTPSPTIFNYITDYTWRVDSVNLSGITTGDEWTFTTIRLDPPKVTYWYSTTGQYYQLLIQADGSYGDHPADGGVENTDFVYLAAGYEPNFVKTTRRLVSIANSKVWYEQI